MKHLTDDQVEEILLGVAKEPPHARECSVCRAKLAGHRAVRARLKSAFRSVRAGVGLQWRVRTDIEVRRPREDLQASAARPGRRRLRFGYWPISAAAAIVLVVVGLSIHLAGPSEAVAAQEELVKIHNHNLSPHGEFYSEADPEKLAKYFKEKLDFAPKMPRSDHPEALRGCCIAHFRGKPVGSYVVETPRGVISVIVVADDPKSLGVNRKIRHGGSEYLAGSFAKCSIVATRLGSYTYCAVAEVPPDLLVDLLSRLMETE